MLLSNSHLHWGDRNTYFEVQLTSPGVTSYGAVWVGFPVLRQCFTEYLGWTQTTNPPNLATLYRLSLTDGGYDLDGSTQPFAVERQVLKVLREDGTVDSEPLTIRRCAHGPVVAEEQGEAVALRVAGTARPRMLEQFWRMGLARNLEQFHAAMAMQQLPLFNTMYGDRDGHIMYLYNAALPLREPADERFWRGLVPGNDSALIWSSAVVPYAEPAQGDRSAGRLGAELQRLALDLHAPDGAGPRRLDAAGRPRAQPHAALHAQHPAAVAGGQDQPCRPQGDEAVDPRRVGRPLRGRPGGGCRAARRRAGAACRGDPATLGPRDRQRQRRRAPVPPLPDRCRRSVRADRRPRRPGRPRTSP